MKMIWLLSSVVICMFATMAFFPAQESGNAIRKEDATADLTIDFIHKIGERNLLPDSNYENDFGESFKIHQFKYYISNLVFHRQGRTKSFRVPDSYFLVDENQPESKSIRLSIPVWKYSAVSFLIGVDSLKCVSGAQDGALDPINGMFWTWNTGYIMAKLEGASVVSTLPRRMFEYHIGGYRSPNSVLNVVTLPLNSELPVNDNNTATTITILVDLKKWFKSDHELRIAKNPACTTPGSLAQQYAENYKTMFSIINTAQ